MTISLKKLDYLCMNSVEIKFAGISLISYTASKITGFATVSLKDTWHFQALQELAFLAAIVSSAIAVITFHRNYMKNNKKRD